MGVDVFALVDLAEFIFGQRSELSFASFMDAARTTFWAMAKGKSYENI